MTAFDWVVSTASHVQRLTREMQMTSTSKLYKVQHLVCTVVGVPGGVRHEIWPISQLYSNNRSWLGYRISSNNCRPSPPLWYEIKNNRLSPPPARLLFEEIQYANTEWVSRKNNSIIKDERKTDILHSIPLALKGHRKVL